MVVPYTETSIPYTEANDIMAMRGCRTQLLNYYGDKSSPPIVNNYTTTRKQLGKAMADSDLASALYNNNPTNVWY